MGKLAIWRVCQGGDPSKITLEPLQLVKFVILQILNFTQRKNDRISENLKITFDGNFEEEKIN